MPERKNMAAASGAESAGGNAGKLSRGAGIPEYLRVGHGSVYRRAEGELSPSAGTPEALPVVPNQRSGKET